MSLFNKTLRRSSSSGGSEPRVTPVRMSGTVVETLNSNPHKSDSLTEQVDTGLMGNDYKYPEEFEFIVETPSSNRRQDIARSGLSDGPAPGKIPYMYQQRNKAKTGKEISGYPDGDAYLLLSISGSPNGGMGDAMYIPHVSILRPAGMARGAMRTIDDGAMIPGVFVADPTRR